MKNRFRKDLILLVAGLSVLVLTQIVSYYITLTDLVGGTFLGIGIGILAISLLHNRRKSAY